MKKTILICLSLTALLLSACSISGTSANPENNSFRVYRLARNDSDLGQNLLQPETHYYTDAENILELAVTALKSPPANPALEVALPDAVCITETKREGAVAILTMNNSFNQLSGLDKTIVESAITLTMCSIPGITRVIISTSTNPEATSLSAEDIVLTNTVTSTDEQQIRLYFPRRDISLLAPESRSITSLDNSTAERITIDHLLRGPASALLNSPIPHGTVILSVYTQAGVCTINLSAEFLAIEDAGEESIELAIYSIVNSLTNLPNVNSVKINIQTMENSRLGTLDLSEPLTRKTALIGPAITD